MKRSQLGENIHHTAKQAAELAELLRNVADVADEFKDHAEALEYVTGRMRANRQLLRILYDFAAPYVAPGRKRSLDSLEDNLTAANAIIAELRSRGF